MAPGIMPGETGHTGWVLWPLTVDRDVSSIIRGSVRLHVPDGGVAAYMIVVLMPGATVPTTVGNVRASDGTTEANLGGPRAECCGYADWLLCEGCADGGDGIAVGGRLAPGQVAWLGVAAYEWGARTTLSVRVDVSDGAVLTVGEPIRGTDVRAVDLAREARHAGESVRPMGHPTFGTTFGTGLAAWDLGTPGVAVGDYNLRADGQGDLSTGLPGGFRFDDRAEPDGWGVFSAYLAPGHLDARLTDFHDGESASLPLTQRDWSSRSAMIVWAGLPLPIAPALYEYHGV